MPKAAIIAAPTSVALRASALAVPILVQPRLVAIKATALTVVIVEKT